MTIATCPGDCTICFSGCCVSPRISPGQTVADDAPLGQPAVLPAVSLVRPRLRLLVWLPTSSSASRVNGGILPVGWIDDLRRAQRYLRLSSDRRSRTRCIRRPRSGSPAAHRRSGRHWRIAARPDRSGRCSASSSSPLVPRRQPKPIARSAASSSVMNSRVPNAAGRSTGVKVRVSHIPCRSGSPHGRGRRLEAALAGHGIGRLTGRGNQHQPRDDDRDRQATH